MTCSGRHRSWRRRWSRVTAVAPRYLLRLVSKYSKLELCSASRTTRPKRGTSGLWQETHTPTSRQLDLTYGDLPWTHHNLSQYRKNGIPGQQRRSSLWRRCHERRREDPFDSLISCLIRPPESPACAVLYEVVVRVALHSEQRPSVRSCTDRMTSPIW
jgi:hypothetical protein